MTPPKLGFLRPNKVSWAQKSFQGPPKTQKNDFLKKPDFCDLTKHWRWFPQQPWSPRYHQTPVYNSKINYIAVAQCDLSSQFKVFHSFSRKVRTKNQHQLTLLYPGGRNYKSIVKKIWLKRMCIQLNDSFMGSIDYFKSNT